MIRFNFKILLLIIITLFLIKNTKAQQFKPNTEIGILGGISYYLGDLNTTHFYQSSPSAGLIIRQNADQRFVYKAELMYINLRSDDQNPFNIRNYQVDSKNKLHFRSPVYELSGQLEFNFLPYQPGHPLYTWTPFIYTGLSLFHFNPQAENKDGEWINLQELGTEGQGTTTFPDRKKYSLIQFAIPIGGGVKIAINESFNIMLEYGIRKTFTDYIDDVSTTFPGNGLNDMSNAAIDMSDPSRDHLKDDQRGDETKKDWFAFTGITLSFKLNNNTKGCYP